MVSLLPLSTDPTLDAMRAAVEEREKAKPPRTHLGASVLGHECERFAWLSLYYPQMAVPMEYRGCAAVEDGHRTEQLIKDRLRLVPGVEIWDIDETTKEQIGFKEDKFGGSCDAIIQGLLQAPKTVHIFEAKACNEKKFNELKKCIDKFGEKDAIQQWDYIFYIQAQIYMGKISEHYQTKIDRHYLVCCTPGGRDEVSCRTDFNRPIYEANLHKKDRIINAKQPPARITKMRELLICKWCKFNKFCWEELK